MSLLRRFVSANIALCERLDGLLPHRLRLHGNPVFVAEYIPRAVLPGAVIYAVGGGSRPFISAETKERFGLTVVGLDVDAEELANAPAGVYDRTVTADLCTYTGQADADAVICQATLEHVADTAAAMRAIASIVKPGGHVYIFAPCRNALFARVNRMLPETFKRRLLAALFDHAAEGHEGFEAHYDRCTPGEIEALAAENGLDVEERRLFWRSRYFMTFAPAFVLWRCWQAVHWLVAGDEAAETFIYVLHRGGRSDTARPGVSGRL